MRPLCGVIQACRWLSSDQATDSSPPGSEQPLSRLQPVCCSVSNPDSSSLLICCEMGSHHYVKCVSPPSRPDAWTAVNRAALKLDAWRRSEMPGARASPIPTAAYGATLQNRHAGGCSASSSGDGALWMSAVDRHAQCGCFKCNSF